LPLSATLDDLATALAGLGDKMEEQRAAAGELGIALRPAPREALGALMQLFREPP
jgi:hypothetical protein